MIECRAFVMICMTAVKLFFLGLDYMHLVAGTAALALPLSYVISRKVCKRNCRQRSRECISVLVDKTGKKCEMIAHKGAALDGPENTLGAIERVSVILFLKTVWLRASRAQNSSSYEQIK